MLMRQIEKLQASIARELPRRLFNIRVADDAQPKIGALHELLEKRPDWNVVLYFNHTAYGDPAIWAHMARTVDPKATRSVAILASAYHTSFRNNPAFATISRLGGLLGGIRMIPTIQTYQVNNPDYGYSEADAMANGRNLLRTIRHMHKPLMLLISPEGHRSDDGALGKVEEGVVSLGTRLAPVFYIPVGVAYERPYERNGLNSRLTQRNPPVAHVEVGNMTEQVDHGHRPSIRLLMHELSQTLPRDLRGKWD